MQKSRDSEQDQRSIDESDRESDAKALHRRIKDLERQLADAMRDQSATAAELELAVMARDQSDDAKRRSDQTFRHLVETSAQSIVVHKGWQPLFANQAYADLYGYDDVSEIIASGSIEPMFAPRELDRLAEFRKARLADLPAPTTFEVEGVRKDGSTIWTENSVRLIEIDGDEAIQCTVVETTRRRQAEVALLESEERFRSLFENAPISIREEDFSEVKASIDALRIEGEVEFGRYLDDHPEFVADCARPIREVDANQACLDLHQIEDKRVFLDTFTDSFSEPALRTFRTSLEAIHRGDRMLAFETTVARPGGGVRDVAARWSVVTGHEDTYGRTLFISVDITDRKRAEKALSES